MEDLRELLAKVRKNKPDSEVEQIEESELQKYLKKVKRGLDRVPSYVIYYHYYINSNEKLNKIVFFREFSKKFKQKRTGKQRFYSIEKDSLGFSEQDFDRAKSFDKEYNEQKKKNKVSRTRSKCKSKN